VTWRRSAARLRGASSLTSRTRRTTRLVAVHRKPDTVQAQVQNAIIFSITAALYGNITLKAGNVGPGNFDIYQILRMNEAPSNTLFRRRLCAYGSSCLLS
jgi:hypothetical protein